MRRFASFLFLVLFSNATAEKVEVDKFNHADGSHLVRVSMDSDLEKPAGYDRLHCLRDLKPYWIGNREVTNRQYLRFVTSSGYTETDPRWTSAAADDGPDEPVKYVSRNDADAYARWAGLRLPNWAECSLAVELNRIERVKNWEWVTPYPSRDSVTDWELQESGAWFDQSTRFSLSYSFLGHSLFNCLPIFRTTRGPSLGFRCACDAI